MYTHQRSRTFAAADGSGGGGSDSRPLKNMSYLISQQQQQQDSSDDYNRKLGLLRQLKVTLESLMFEHSNVARGGGGLTMFSRHIASILEDGIAVAFSADNVTTAPSSSLWSFVLLNLKKEVDNDELLTDGEEDELLERRARKDFDFVLKQMPATATDDQVLEWIKCSLRHRLLATQLAYLSKRAQQQPLQQSYYASDAFVSDESFVRDLLVYVRAYEQSNYSLLNEIKRKFYDVPKTTAATTPSNHRRLHSLPPNLSSASSSAVAAHKVDIDDTDDDESSTTTPSTPTRAKTPPNIFVTAAAAATQRQITSPNNNNDNDSTASTTTLTTKKPAKQQQPIGPIDVDLSLNVNGIDFENEDENEGESSAKNGDEDDEDIYAKTSVFDFIHTQQILCDTSALDRENSHFLICEIAIAAIELIKTQSLVDGVDFVDENAVIESLPPLPPSQQHRATSPKPISKQTALLDAKHPHQHHRRAPSAFSGLGENFSSSSAEQETFWATMSDSVSMPSSTAGPPPHPSSSTASSPPSDNSTSLSLHQQQLSSSFDSTKPSQPQQPTMHHSYSQSTLLSSSFSHLAATKLAAASSPKDKDYEFVDKIKDFALPKPGAKSNDEKSRRRRYSWETAESGDLLSAEALATHLIELALQEENGRLTDLYMKKKQGQSDKSLQLCVPPNLRQLELFIQHLEYYEQVQTYFNLRSSGKLPTQQQQQKSQQADKSPSKNSSKQNSRRNSQMPQAIAPSNDDQRNSFQQKSLLDKMTRTLINFANRNASSSLATSASKARLAAITAATELQEKLLLQQQQQQQQSSSLSLSRQISTASSMLFNSYSSSSLLNSSLSPTSPKTLIRRIRGDDTWAPVREQLILNRTIVKPKPKRAELMLQQHYRCADCGTSVSPDQIKTFNYCEYFGKFFCRCCHVHQTSYIPLYIVNNLDFRDTYEVSKKAKNFLEKIYAEPLINLESLNPTLFEGQSSGGRPSTFFGKIKVLRLKLYNSKRYIMSCRFADDLRRVLETEFDDFIVNDPNVYSIKTLYKFKKENFYDVMKQTVTRIIEHIRKCAICSVQGFVCEICMSNELLYPFDLDKVEKCPNCLTCFHKQCFRQPCPKCKRIKERHNSTPVSSPTTSAAASADDSINPV